MKYYKIIKDDKVIAVIDSPVWVTQLPNGSIVRCALHNAMGLVSVDGNETWHIAGAKKFVSEGRSFDDVEAIYISNTEAENLMALLDLGATVDKASEIAWSSEGDSNEEEPAEEEDSATLCEVRERKLKLLNAQSYEAVYTGADVLLSDGSSEHFSFGIEEQLDLVTLFSLTTIGKDSIPFHNSSGEYKWYCNEDMLNIINAANKLKLYHAAYMGSLKRWIDSMTDIVQISSINYGDPIPEVYHTELYQNILSQV